MSKRALRVIIALAIAAAAAITVAVVVEGPSAAVAGENWDT